MKFFILVPVDISANEQIYGNAVESRMKASAVEAVSNALSQVQDMGFNHDMSDITSIAVDFDSIRVVDSDNV